MTPATPVTKAKPASNGSPTAPSATATANAAEQRGPHQSVTAMMRNRSHRSASAPDTSPSSSQADCCAVCTSAT